MPDPQPLTAACRHDTVSPRRDQAERGKGSDREDDDRGIRPDDPAGPAVPVRRCGSGEGADTAQRPPSGRVTDRGGGVREIPDEFRAQVLAGSTCHAFDIEPVVVGEHRAADPEPLVCGHVRPLSVR